MHRSPHLRNWACGALMGLSIAGGVQAQSTAAGVAGNLPDFTGIVQQNAGAVVRVEAKYGTKINARQLQAMQDPQTEILRRFFGIPGVPMPQQRQGTSLGSGFIISGDGYVLTNTHVVKGADEVTVRLQDRRTLTAKVVGSDPQYDIALLKVNAGRPLPTVKIGDSRALKPGQWVLAIGSPLGFDYTVTQGIVSAVGRNLGREDQPYTSFIQTDVPINRGNSGGPLFNLQGEVVGINSQIYSNTGGYMGVAFSIPIDVAMNAVQQLKSKGYVSRGQLGVEVQQVDDGTAKALGLPNGEGAIVAQVEPGSSAAKAGIQVQDIITSFNGQPIHESSDLPPLVGITKPGSVVPVEILRDGKKRTLQVTVGEQPRSGKTLASVGGGAAAGAASLGFTVKDLDSASRNELGLEKSQAGVLVNRITSPFAGMALRPGDLILRVNRQPVSSVAQFREATKNAKPGQSVLLLVRRGDQTAFVSLTVPGAQSALPDKDDDQDQDGMPDDGFGDDDQ